MRAQLFVISITEGYLILGEKFIEYKLVSEYEELDEDTQVYIPMKSNYRWTRLRSCITEVMMCYDNKYKVWAVELDFNGVGTKTGWSFDDPKKALALYNRLMEYFKTT